MKNELERLIEDRNDAEADLEHLYEELSAIEREFPDPEVHEEMDEWNSLFREVSEQENHVSYLTACIDSIEGGYEEE